MEIKFWDINKKEYVDDPDLVFVSSGREQGVWKDASKGCLCWDLSYEENIEAHIFHDGKIIARIEPK